jgi:hypothetical protein
MQPPNGKGVRAKPKRGCGAPSTTTNDHWDAGEREKPSSASDGATVAPRDGWGLPPVCPSPASAIAAPASFAAAFVAAAAGDRDDWLA